MSWSEANNLLTFSVYVSDEETVEGRVVVMATDRVSLRFDSEQAPVFGLGAVTLLRVVEKLSGVPFELSARVTRRMELEGERQYEFHLLEPQVLWNALSEDALVLVNFDPTSRAQPAAAEPILVELGTGRDVIEVVGKLTDVSVVGLAVVVPERLPDGVGEELAKVDCVHVDFRLPGCPGPLRAWARIRRRSLSDEGRRYGLMFDDERTEDLAELQFRLAQYVMDRRREESLAVSVAPRTRSIQEKMSSAMLRVSTGFIALVAAIVLVLGDRGDLALTSVYGMVLIWFLGGLALIGALSFWLSRFIARRLARPLEALTRVSTELAEGNLDVSVNETGTRELTILSESFNRMAERIQELLADVRKKARLVESQKAELELMKAKDEFLLIASHELRTPLTSILSFAEILLGFGGNLNAEEEAEFLRIIKRESQNLANLVNQFLDLTRMQSGMMNWDVDEMDLDLVARRAAERTVADEDGPDVELRFECDDRGTWLYRGDEHRVFQVVTNLVQNGRKFSPAGAVLEVGLRAMETAFEIRVADRGCGIPAGERERIFDAFVQARDLLTDRPGGSGLGLSITREIVEFHGGSIESHERAGGGTVFLVRLPYPDPEESRPVDKYWMLKLAAQKAAELAPV